MLKKNIMDNGVTPFSAPVYEGNQLLLAWTIRGLIDAPNVSLVYSEVPYFRPYYRQPELDVSSDEVEGQYKVRVTFDVTTGLPPRGYLELKLDGEIFAAGEIFVNKKPSSPGTFIGFLDYKSVLGSNAFYKQLLENVGSTSADALTATQQAQIATDKAGVATTKAGEAVGSAQAASDSASAASGSASAANQSKNDASGSAQAASNSAGAANQSKLDAQTAATASVAAWKGVWTVNTDYVEGNRFTRNNVEYRVKVAFNSGSTFTYDPTKLDIVSEAGNPPTGSVTRDSLGADLKPLLQELPSESGFLYAIIDGISKRVFGISTSAWIYGKFFIEELHIQANAVNGSAIKAGVVALTHLAQAVKDKLLDVGNVLLSNLATEVKALMFKDYDSTGRSQQFVVIDTLSQIVMQILNNGKLKARFDYSDSPISDRKSVV